MNQEERTFAGGSPTSIEISNLDTVTTTTNGFTSTLRSRAADSLRRRRASQVFEPPSLFDYQPDARHRSKLSLKDLSEAYFRSPTTQLCMLFLSLMSCVLFCIETYYRGWGVDILAISILELVITIAFIADYILSCSFALDWRAYVLSMNGIIDLISILPAGTFAAYHLGILSVDQISSGAYLWLDIGNLSRILRGMKVFRVMRFSAGAEIRKGAPMSSHYARGHFTGSSVFEETNFVTAQIIRLVFWLIGIIFISSGIVWFIETYEGYENSFNLPDGLEKMEWHDSLYFIGVTLATVGYGDIYPNSNLARMATLFFVFFFLAAIPYQIGKLVEAISLQSAYRTNYFTPLKHTEHAVILGRVTYPILASFVEQFLHGDKLLEHHFRLVVLSPRKPCGWVRSLLEHPRYNDRIQYLQGRPWDAEDLRRAGAGHAQAIFILAEFGAPDIAKDQDRILLTAVAARKYLIRQYDDDHDDADLDEDEHACLQGQHGHGEEECEPAHLPLFRTRPSASFVTKAMDAASHLMHIESSRHAHEGDNEISDRIVIQTHTTSAMDELTRGLGFRRTYCPHIARLRLMAYGTIFPGLVSFFMNLMRGDPYSAKEVADQPKWLQAFRLGAAQAIVRHHLVLPVDSCLKGRTFAEVACYLYNWHGIVLIGVEVNGVFLMNPHKLFRFLPDRSPAVSLYFIAPSFKVVAEALEAMQHRHWDKMEVEHCLRMPPSVKLSMSDLPPPRTSTLENIFCAGRQRQQRRYSSRCYAPEPPHEDMMSRGTSLPAQQQSLGVASDRSMRARSLPHDHACGPCGHDHEGLLSEAQRIITEAHETHQINSPKSTSTQGVATYGGGGKGGGAGLPSMATKMVDPVIQRVHSARDVLTRLLDGHYNPMPIGGLRNHVVLGMCNEVSPSLDAFGQYVTAFRKLVHLPIVVLTNDSERFQGLIERVKEALSQSCRKIKGWNVPTASEIYFVKGSPKNKTDLQSCSVETAYAVVLLGGDLPRKEGASIDDANDPVASDRHVLLSCFKLEGILQQKLYNKVLTLIDLRNEVNIDLLRQRVRPPAQQRYSESYRYLGHQPSQSCPIGFPPCSPVRPKRASSLDSNPASSARPRSDSNSLTRGERSGSGAGETSSFLSPSRRPRSTVIEHKWTMEHHKRPSDRTSRPEQGSPLFAAGRVCCRSFFDVLFIYLYKNPTALKFWKELIRSRLDDLGAVEFQMGASCGEDVDGEEEEINDIGSGNGGDDEEKHIPEGYNGCELYMDTTGEAKAPPQLNDLQDSIDTLRSSLDQMPLPPAFVGRYYGELVDALLVLGIVPMGLYRPRGLMAAPMPFSVVNPPAATRLVKADLIYVLRPSTSTVL